MKKIILFLLLTIPFTGFADIEGKEPKTDISCFFNIRFDPIPKILEDAAQKNSICESGRFLQSAKWLNNETFVFDTMTVYENKSRKIQVLKNNELVLEKEMGSESSSWNYTLYPNSLLSRYGNHTLTKIQPFEETEGLQTKTAKSIMGYYIDGKKITDNFELKLDKNTDMLDIFYFHWGSGKVEYSYSYRLSHLELQTIDAFLQKFTSKKENISKISKIIEKISSAQKKVEKKESSKEKRIYEILSYIKTELKITKLKEHGINAK